MTIKTTYPYEDSNSPITIIETEFGHYLVLHRCSTRAGKVNGSDGDIILKFDPAGYKDITDAIEIVSEIAIELRECRDEYN